MIAFTKVRVDSAQVAACAATFFYRGQGNEAAQKQRRACSANVLYKAPISRFFLYVGAKPPSIRHTPIVMRRSSTFAVLLWVIAVAMLPIRMANAHLHFCFDGQSQPVSLHVQDVPTHTAGSHGHQDGGHNDRDVDYSASVVAAKHTNGGGDHDLGLLTAYVVAILLPVECSVEPAAEFRVLDPTSVFNLRPPVRGPPL